MKAYGERRGEAQHIHHSLLVYLPVTVNDVQAY